MASRVQRRAGSFDGSLGRWVTPEEAQAIRDELDALRTLSDLIDWAGPRRGHWESHRPRRVEVSRWAPPYPSGAPGREFVSVSASARDLLRRGTRPSRPFDIPSAFVEAIVELACHRRLSAVVEWARPIRRDIGEALGSLPRCPACGEVVDPRGAWFRLYCEAHRDEERTDALGLLA